jgi:hypothetical protein
LPRGFGVHVVLIIFQPFVVGHVIFCFSVHPYFIGQSGKNSGKDFEFVVFFRRIKKKYFTRPLKISYHLEGKTDQHSGNSGAESFSEEHRHCGHQKNYERSHHVEPKKLEERERKREIREGGREEEGGGRTRRDALLMWVLMDSKQDVQMAQWDL